MAFLPRQEGLLQVPQSMTGTRHARSVSAQKNKHLMPEEDLVSPLYKWAVKHFKPETWRWFKDMRATRSYKSHPRGHDTEGNICFISPLLWVVFVSQKKNKKKPKHLPSIGCSFQKSWFTGFSDRSSTLQCTPVGICAQGRHCLHLSDAIIQGSTCFGQVFENGAIQCISAQIIKVSLTSWNLKIIEKGADTNPRTW